MQEGPTQEHEVSGIKVGGRNPKALLLSDGTRLALEDAENPSGRSEWTRFGENDGRAEEVTVADAMRLAGEDHAGYVAVRTRAEVEWLNLVAEWYREQAEKLSVDLAAAH